MEVTAEGSNYPCEWELILDSSLYHILLCPVAKWLHHISLSVFFLGATAYLSSKLYFFFKVQEFVYISGQVHIEVIFSMGLSPSLAQ